MPTCSERANKRQLCSELQTLNEGASNLVWNNDRYSAQFADIEAEKEDGSNDVSLGQPASASHRKE
jgi:hypothetical protein